MMIQQEIMKSFIFTYNFVIMSLMFKIWIKINYWLIKSRIPNIDRKYETDDNDFLFSHY